MKNTKGPKPPSSSHGNILAKSSKLTIEVPEDEVEQTRVKFNKNSPSNAKIQIKPESKPNPPIFASKNKTPSSTQATKRCYGETGVSKAPQKIFKFPSTPKSKVPETRPSNIFTSRTKSKVATPVSKLSVSPSQKLEEHKKRPRSAANPDKNVLKPETGSSPSLNILVTQVKSTGKDQALPSDVKAKSEMLYKEHLFQTFQALKFVKGLQPVNLEQLKERRVNVPRRKGFEGKKTLIFDLDETLVHCCEDINKNKPMVILPIVFPTGEVVQAGINIRPYALECLREASKDFEVFVFTASHPCYANVVLDYLDPKRELIQQRFFRDSCINMGGVYIKDLRIFANRSLKDLIIVDNAAYSFAYQLDNGIPIVSWHDDPYDEELYNLMDYVKALAVADDVRDINEQTFHLRTFYDDYFHEFLQ